jgi:hypothetical protein
MMRQSGADSSSGGTAMTSAPARLGGRQPRPVVNRQLSDAMRALFDLPALPPLP